MARLELNFFDGNQHGNHSRILDTDCYPIGHEWLVGRVTDISKPDISLKHDTVSRSQAFIRCITQYQREQWQIKHVGRNPTYRQMGKTGKTQLALEYWTNIHDDDVFTFGFGNEGFRATTAIDETLQEDCMIDETPTVNETINAAIAQHTAALQEAEAAAKKSSDRPWYAELVLLVLNGPEGFPNWLWWLFLLASVLLYVILKYGG
jgi:hypothetical protein